MKKYKYYAFVLLAGTFWGCMGLFTRTLYNAGIDTSNVVALRIFGGFVVLTAFLALTDRSVFRVQVRDLPVFLAMGLGCILLNTWLYFRCQKYCSLAVSAVLLYTEPAFVTLLSTLIFHEKITRRKVLALVLALLGCTLITGVWGGDLTVTPKGALLGLGAAFAYGFYSILGKLVLKKYSPMAVVYWAILFAGLGALFLFDFPALAAGFTADPRMILAALGMMTLCMVVPYVLYTVGLSGMESAKASILSSVEPVVATFGGILLFGEPISLSVFLGLACILACVYILR